jgi:5-oxoprolinase (ATP-hydrolysing) subunit A
VTIDLNCDMGELPENVANGTQEAMMAHISSVNVACGAHAGDENTMRETVRQAARWKLAIGAHPGYPDRENFGRSPMKLPAAAVTESVYEQVLRLAGIAQLMHVKPHGALYNEAARDPTLAAAIAEGVRRVSPDLILVGLAGSAMLDAFRRAGFRVAAEAFADRRYEPGGSLRPRRHRDALLSDPDEAAEQAARIVMERCTIAWDGSRVPVDASTICIHGDSPGAVAIAAAVSRKLRDSGVLLRPLR